MKKNLILLFVFLSLSLPAQSNMKEDLSKLFLDLNLDLAPNNYSKELVNEPVTSDHIRLKNATLLLYKLKEESI